MKIGEIEVHALPQFFQVKFANQSNALTVNNWFAVWTHFETKQVNTFLDYPPEDPGGTQQSLIRRGSALRSNPLPFYTILTEKVPFSIPSIDKWHPISHN